MLFVGLTRFSLYMPRSTQWVASNQSRLSDAEYLAHLYDDERLNLRCHVFFNFTLPMIAHAAQGHDVRHVIAYSRNLPQQYREQLEASAELYDFVDLAEVSVGDDFDLQPRVLEEIERRGWGESPMGVYRLDDDDVLSADFFDQMTPHIIPEHLGWVVTLAAGMTAIYLGGRFYMVRAAYLPLHSKGHLAVAGWRDGEFVLPPQAPHNESDRILPVVLDSRRVSHLWVRSTTQDGALYQLGMDRDEQLKKMIAEFRKLDTVTVEEIASAFPVLKSAVTLEEPAL